VAGTGRRSNGSGRAGRRTVRDQPVRFSPDVETVEPDEAETVAGLEAQCKIIRDTTSADYGHAVRSVHAKGHGLAKGSLTVAQDLPAELAQGLFAAPGTYDSVLRLSTNTGDILDDSIALPCGLALKVMGVAGARLAGTEGDSTQNFVMVNGPAFAAPDPKKFLSSLKLLAKTTDKTEGTKKALSALFRGAEAVLEAVGGESSFLQTLGGAKPVHPLAATYYTQTPFRYGASIAKFSLVPVSAIKDFANETINAHGRPDALRTAVNELLIEQVPATLATLQSSRPTGTGPKPWRYRSPQHCASKSRPFDHVKGAEQSGLALELQHSRRLRHTQTHAGQIFPDEIAALPFTPVVHDRRDPTKSEGIFGWNMGCGLRKQEGSIRISVRKAYAREQRVDAFVMDLRRGSQCRSRAACGFIATEIAILRGIETGSVSAATRCATSVAWPVAAAPPGHGPPSRILPMNLGDLPTQCCMLVERWNSRPRCRLRLVEGDWQYGHRIACHYETGE